MQPIIIVEYGIIVVQSAWGGESGGGECPGGGNALDFLGGGKCPGRKCPRLLGGGEMSGEEMP